MKATKSYLKDQIIAKEGDPSNKIYILVDGSIGVLKGNIMVSKSSELGTLFGEIGTVLNQPRTATLVALRDSEVIEIEGTIEEIVSSYPDISIRLLKMLAKRLATTTEDYWYIAEEVRL
ncbi:MAG: cyclic nucleotide-binding domain-containing protein [Ignavibacteria bacterium]|jgi:CRP-like cAMP-binding protein